MVETIIWPVYADFPECNTPMFGSKGEKQVLEWDKELETKTAEYGKRKNLSLKKSSVRLLSLLLCLGGEVRGNQLLN